ncbi:MAG: 6-carboxytetrahydropterin synthase [Bacteroidetes bacterium]|nr:6-carboxytetrahydropterin synthase [Bacteroidota bacterium]
MSIIRITKEFKFEMAHALKGYIGPCRNIHGHSYELFVTVKGEPVNNPGSSDNGMVIDFKLLKSIVRENIIDLYDHALVLHKDSAALINDESRELYGKLVTVEYQPTSENLLIYFAEVLKQKLPNTVKLHSLFLRETVTSFAEWFAEDNE